MSKIQSFGYDPNLKYKDRRAAYAVIITGGNRVAAVKGREKYWLPGGGSLKDETAEETIIREVREELGMGVQLIKEIGQAIQFFYAANEDCCYKMDATFFLAEFTNEPLEIGENELHWLLIEEASRSFFHESHTWATNQAVLLKSS